MKLGKLSLTLGCLIALAFAAPSARAQESPNDIATKAAAAAAAKDGTSVEGGVGDHSMIYDPTTGKSKPITAPGKFQPRENPIDVSTVSEEAAKNAEKNMAFTSLTLNDKSAGLIGASTSINIDGDGNYKIVTDGGMAHYVRIDGQGKLTAAQMKSLKSSFDKMVVSNPPSQLPINKDIMGAGQLTISYDDANGSHSLAGSSALGEGLTGDDAKIWAAVSPIVKKLQGLESKLGKGLDTTAKPDDSKDGDGIAPPSKDAAPENLAAETIKAAADAAAKAGTSVEGGVPQAIKDRGKDAPRTGMDQVLTDRMDDKDHPDRAAEDR